MSFYIFQAQKGKSNALFERLSSPQLNGQSLPRGSTRPEQLSFPGIIPISLSRGGGGRFMLYRGSALFTMCCCFILPGGLDVTSWC